MADQDRWYDPTSLKVVTERLKADGTPTSRITVRDAENLGLVPSVTTIIGQVLGAGYSLVQYFKEQVALAARENPIREGEDTDQWTSRIISISEEHASTAADKGTAIHAMIQRWVDTGETPVDPIGLKAVEHLQSLLEGCEAEGPSSEHSIGNGGFCGTPDIYIAKCNLHKLLALLGEEVPEGLDEHGEVVIDLKTTNLSKFRKPYESWLYQLGGYGVLLEIGTHCLALQWIVDRDTGEDKWISYTNLHAWKDAFMRLFDNWCLIKNYRPGQQPTN